MKRFQSTFKPGSLLLHLSFLMLLTACQTSTSTSPAISPKPAVSPAPTGTGPVASPVASPGTTQPALDVPALGLKFVTVQPGSFSMGDDRESPAHTVTLSKGFQIQTTEVTQAQWQAVMGNNPSSFKGADLPVENVSWQDAQSFIQKLNAAGGAYRLPTEAEWEYAARAGSNTVYACGAEEACLTDTSWFIPNAANTTHPVGKKQPNAWGIYDMAGNVSEWVQDRYAAYEAAAVTDPTGPAKGDYRLQRGGSFNNYAKDIRPAARNYGSPDGSDNTVGFRLVRPAP